MATEDTSLHAHGQGHRERVRRRVAERQGASTPAEALEALLTYAVPRKDTRGTAMELLERNGSIRGVIDAGLDHLTGVTNYTRNIPELFAIFKAVRHHYDESPVRFRERITNNDTMYAVARTHLADRRIEEVWAAMLDTGMRLVCWKRMSKGGIDAAYVNIPEILRECLIQRASGLILVHNHPGGSDTPSPQDVATTRRMVAAAQAVGIKIYDHLIITADGYRAIIDA